MQSQVVFYVDMQGKGKSPLPLHSIPKTNNNSKTKSNNKTKTKNKIKVVYTEDLTHPTSSTHSGATLAPVLTGLVRSLVDQALPQVGYDGGDSLCTWTVDGIDPLLRRRTLGG